MRIAHRLPPIALALAGTLAIVAAGCSRKDEPSAPPARVEPPAPPPPAASATPLPPGACEASGSNWGEFLDEGSYRCAPEQSARRDILRCERGKWVKAASCECRVVSSISGETWDTKCYDVHERGAANCGHALDSCLLCSPGGRCETPAPE